MTDSKQAWLAARNRDPDGQWLVGGSELASILGWDPWCDRLKRWAIKRGLVQDEPSGAGEAGIYLEDGVLRWYADKSGRALTRPQEIAEMIRDPETWDPYLDGAGADTITLVKHLREHVVVHYGPDRAGRVTFRSKSTPWAVLSIDAFVLHPEFGWGVVDAKCTDLAFRGQWHEAIPTYRLPQVGHYVQHTGLAWGGWAVCFGGQALEWWDVKADDFAEVNEIVDEEVPRFIAEHLETGEPPDATPSPAMARVLSEIHPVGRPRQRVAWVAPFELDGKLWDPVEFDELWAAATVERKAVEEHWGALQAVVRAVMGPATEVCLSNGTTYRVDRRNAIRRYEPRG